MVFLSNLKFWNSRTMMFGYSLSILITLSACKPRVFISEKEAQNLVVLDSLINEQKEDLIIDYFEEYN